MCLGVQVSYIAALIKQPIIAKKLEVLGRNPFDRSKKLDENVCCFQPMLRLSGLEQCSALDKEEEEVKDPSTGETADYQTALASPTEVPGGFLTLRQVALL